MGKLAFKNFKKQNRGGEWIFSGMNKKLHEKYVEGIR